MEFLAEAAATISSGGRGSKAGRTKAALPADREDEDEDGRGREGGEGGEGGKGGGGGGGEVDVERAEDVEGDGDGDGVAEAGEFACGSSGCEMRFQSWTLLQEHLAITHTSFAATPLLGHPLLHEPRLLPWTPSRGGAGAGAGAGASLQSGSKAQTGRHSHHLSHSSSSSSNVAAGSASGSGLLVPPSSAVIRDVLSFHTSHHATAGQTPTPTRFLEACGDLFDPFEHSFATAITEPQSKSKSTTKAKTKSAADTTTAGNGNGNGNGRRHQPVALSSGEHGISSELGAAHPLGALRDSLQTLREKQTKARHLHRQQEHQQHQHQQHQHQQHQHQHQHQHQRAADTPASPQKKHSSDATADQATGAEYTYVAGRFGYGSEDRGIPNNSHVDGDEDDDDDDDDDDGDATESDEDEREGRADRSRRDSDSFIATTVRDAASLGSTEAPTLAGANKRRLAMAFASIDRLAESQESAADQFPMVADATEITNGGEPHGRSDSEDSAAGKTGSVLRVAQGSANDASDVQNPLSSIADISSMVILTPSTLYQTLHSPPIPPAIAGGASSSASDAAPSADPLLPANPFESSFIAGAVSSSASLVLPLVQPVISLAKPNLAHRARKSLNEQRPTVRLPVAATSASTSALPDLPMSISVTSPTGTTLVETLGLADFELLGDEGAYPHGGTATGSGVGSPGETGISISMSGSSSASRPSDLPKSRKTAKAKLRSSHESAAPSSGSSSMSGWDASLLPPPAAAAEPLLFTSTSLVGPEKGHRKKPGGGGAFVFSSFSINAEASSASAGKQRRAKRTDSAAMLDSEESDGSKDERARTAKKARQLDAGSGNLSDVSGSASGTNGNSSDTEEKRAQALERNRLAAIKCRAKKKMWLTDLEQREHTMQLQNLKLANEVTVLRNEVQRLKQVLSLHANCPVTLALAAEAKANPSLIATSTGAGEGTSRQAPLSSVGYVAASSSVQPGYDLSSKITKLTASSIAPTASGPGSGSGPTEQRMAREGKASARKGTALVAKFPLKHPSQQTEKPYEYQ